MASSSLEVEVQGRDDAAIRKAAVEEGARYFGLEAAKLDVLSFQSRRVSGPGADSMPVYSARVTVFPKVVLPDHR